MTRDDTLTLATSSLMTTKHADCPCREITRTSGDASNTYPMTRAVTRLVMVSRYYQWTTKIIFSQSGDARTRLFNQCVAAIIQASDLRSSQYSFIHSRQTRDACEASGLVTRVVAILTTCMTQSILNFLYKLNLIDTLW